MIGIVFVLSGWVSFLFIADQAVPTPAYEATVSKACKTRPRCFDTIGAVLEQEQGRTLTITIEAGDYDEKIYIDRPNVTLRGAGARKTRIYHALAAENAAPYHRDGWGTPGSATVSVNAENVRLENLTIENNFDYLSNNARAANDPQKLRQTQAVALFLDTESDKVLLQDVVLKGYQDTFFAHGRRAYIRGGAVYGSVDFIFGDGQVLFENVDIVNRFRGEQLPAGHIQSYITAPSTQISDAYGLVFLNCRLLREAGVPDDSTALGRPWHPTTTFSDGRYADPNAIGYAAFIHCYMDAHISDQGWTSMNGTARDGTKTAVFHPQDSRFYELDSHGPGAKSLNLHPERRKLPRPHRLKTIKKTMLGDWSPSE